MRFNILKVLIVSAICLQLTSCKKFLDIAPPKNSLVQETVFQNDGQATSAVTGIYAALSASGYASGDPTSISTIVGTSSDELVGYNGNVPFYENQLTSDLGNIQSFYSGPYQSIYAANAILEGLSGENGVTPPVKAQLQGEAMFMRAFGYFYLVNMYGPVPLQLTTDYRVTQDASRASVDQIYGQIVSDLKAAENLLSENYVTVERVRPNKSAAQAMLARTYLYMKNWLGAEQYASLLISKSTMYNLVDINSIFLANSQEAIWQIIPPAGNNTQEGNTFILTSTPIYVSLQDDFVSNSFEPSDKRKASWISSLTVGDQVYYYPYKYKIRSSSEVLEYSMVLRLAEQYLIRAEARINQPGKLALGISDLNKIRERARPVSTINNPNPLPPLSESLSFTDALLAVERERRVELFSEWGHRWFDLKRTGRANDILSRKKTKWQPTDMLYPIPDVELTRNPNITQNAGY